MSILPSGNNVYVGGYFGELDGDVRYGFAFLPIADAPQLIQDSATTFYIARNARDGAEVSHFLVTDISGDLYRSDGVTPVKVFEFLTVAEGSAGLKFMPGGTVAAVSALNNTIAGAGTAESTLTMTTNPAPVFKFASTAYSVREGQGNIVVNVRKYGEGAAKVDYGTSDITATGGLDYQVRTGTLAFSATDKLKNIIIAIADDLLPENDEGFAIILTNASVGAMIAGPATAVVTIVDNDIIGLSDSLTTTVLPSVSPDSSGAISISLQPTNAYGQWRLLGQLNWHENGALTSGLITGNYGIEFRPVNGYRQPQTLTIPISAGITNRFSFFYTPITNLDTGNLSVIIQPTDVATSADLAHRGQWRRQGGSTNWLNSEDLVPNLGSGSYTVEFKPIPGRLPPAPRIIQVGPNATYSIVGTYLFGSSQGAQTPIVVPFHTATTNEPYLYNGQIQSSVGFGSGFVVKQRVVLTAAHVLFDDVQLSYVTVARWFFERYRDQLEPVAQIPRGWYTFDGYSAQRQLDNSPGISTPESQNLDATAMYFLEDAGRGGYGGYVSTDADDNEYLLSANNKFLVGYPLDGVAETDQGQLQATIPANISFNHLYTSVFATTNIQSFPGNSGGPLYVQTDINQYLPAAIYLGGSGETLVRAINREVVDLINRAEISGNGGGNSTGGGVVVWSPGITASPFNPGLFVVSLGPPDALSRGAGWRVANGADLAYISDTALRYPLVPGPFNIEFKAVPGYSAPATRLVEVVANQTTSIDALYGLISLHNPRLLAEGSLEISLSGGTGHVYAIQTSTDLRNWTELMRLTNFSTLSTITNKLPVNSKQWFYRAQEQ